MGLGFYNPNDIEPPEMEEAKVYCPICGKRLYPGDTVYVDKYDEFIGCNYCVHEQDWYDYEERLSE